MDISAPKEIKDIFPEHHEWVELHKSDNDCGDDSHEERIVYHRHFSKETERGKELYECYICPKCKNIQGKLVMIVKP